MGLEGAAAGDLALTLTPGEPKLRAEGLAPSLHSPQHDTLLPLSFSFLHCSIPEKNALSFFGDNHGYFPGVPSSMEPFLTNVKQTPGRSLFYSSYTP